MCVCTHACARVCVCMCVHLCESQRTDSGSLVSLSTMQVPGIELWSLGLAADIFNHQPSHQLPFYYYFLFSKNDKTVVLWTWKSQCRIVSRLYTHLLCNFRHSSSPFCSSLLVCPKTMLRSLFLWTCRGMSCTSKGGLAATLFVLL